MRWRGGLTGPRLAWGKLALSAEPGRPGQLAAAVRAFVPDGCRRVSCLAGVFFLRICLHVVVGLAAWLCQLCTVKSALSEAGVPICTW